ncbi:response regulator transcription factor [Bacteroides faecis]|jgi:hypothetical protein|uniref:response regulator n=1 Tax=Bacteroides faecis TaxID=674529 RepID=UPI000D648DC7|nr:response regulator transcription factor [Bacteroides faecis]KAA5267536.1 response regulator transcription factor [Bacteroides faecis]MCB6633129.1 response regulator transcription factor [Bacteroides faecis]MCE8942309.1 response regulator transcription factor [Bacteroides faecis]MCE9010752.1 response regulator transcription factor [Bacteroides faecis]MCS2652150.1 response regulator transcription factor [Bacteroides faecis]
MKENRQISALLVDDHDLVLQGLKRILEYAVPEIKMICKVSSGKEALSLIDIQPFELFLLDVELPDMSGIDLIASIRKKQPKARIMVNTMHEEIWFVRSLLQCNLDAILFKSIDSRQVVDAVHAVLQGKKYFCPYVERVRLQLKSQEKNRKNELTLRELDVLKLLSEGKSTQEIAQELCVSANTVDTHRRHLMEKLDARNVVDLVVIAISRGIIPIRS